MIRSPPYRLGSLLIFPIPHFWSNNPTKRSSSLDGRSIDMSKTILLACENCRRRKVGSATAFLGVRRLTSTRRCGVLALRQVSAAIARSRTFHAISISRDEGVDLGQSARVPIVTVHLRLPWLNRWPSCQSSPPISTTRLEKTGTGRYGENRLDIWTPQKSGEAG